MLALLSAPTSHIWETHRTQSPWSYASRLCAHMQYPTSRTRPVHADVGPATNQSLVKPVFKTIAIQLSISDGVCCCPLILRRAIFVDESFLTCLRRCSEEYINTFNIGPGGETLSLANSKILC